MNSRRGISTGLGKSPDPSRVAFFRDLENLPRRRATKPITSSNGAFYDWETDVDILNKNEKRYPKPKKRKISVNSETPKPYQIGMRVEVKLEDWDDFYPGEVTHVWSDGRCKVVFDDGRDEKKVPIKYIREVPKEYKPNDDTDSETEIFCNDDANMRKKRLSFYPRKAKCAMYRPKSRSSRYGIEAKVVRNLMHANSYLATIETTNWTRFVGVFDSAEVAYESCNVLLEQIYDKMSNRSGKKSMRDTGSSSTKSSSHSQVTRIPAGALLGSNSDSLNESPLNVNQAYLNQNPVSADNTRLASTSKPVSSREQIHKMCAIKLKSIKFPYESSGIKLMSPGRVITSGPNAEKYHTSKYLYPVGFCIVRMYFSQWKPLEKCEYRCEILEGEKGPRFVVSMEGWAPFEGSSPTRPWVEVLRSLNERRRTLGLPVGGKNLSGPIMFGLDKRDFQILLQGLPGAIDCQRYLFVGEKTVGVAMDTAPSVNIVPDSIKREPVIKTDVQRKRLKPKDVAKLNQPKSKFCVEKYEAIENFLV